MSLIYFLLIGLLAGWLAGVYMGKDFTLVGNLIIGVVGAMIGGFLFQCLGFRASHLLGELVMATVGAVIFLAILQRIGKKKRRRRR
jgi:uncharacterized membrane protein YeaQ/YmgE (transglycosylase-associated protein family)